MIRFLLYFLFRSILHLSRSFMINESHLYFLDFIIKFILGQIFFILWLFYIILLILLILCLLLLFVWLSITTFLLPAILSLIRFALTLFLSSIILFKILLINIFWIWSIIDLLFWLGKLICLFRKLLTILLSFISFLMSWFSLCHYFRAIPLCSLYLNRSSAPFVKGYPSLIFVLSGSFLCIFGRFNIYCLTLNLSILSLNSWLLRSIFAFFIWRHFFFIRGLWLFLFWCLLVCW